MKGRLTPTPPQGSRTKTEVREPVGTRERSGGHGGCCGPHRALPAAIPRGILDLGNGPGSRAADDGVLGTNHGKPHFHNTWLWNLM